MIISSSFLAKWWLSAIQISKEINGMSFAFVFQISLCGRVDVFISALKLLVPVLAMASVASPVTFKEFCPLYYLLNAIPTKIQKGFRSIVVYLTALDTNGDYIAVGSSIGMLYLYCRHLNQMKKYNFEVTTFTFFSCDEAELLRIELLFVTH